VVNRVEHDRTRRPLSLGQQLRAARLGSGLKPKDVARRAKLRVAAVYNCDRFDRRGRMRTLLRLAKALSPYYLMIQPTPRKIAVKQTTFRILERISEPPGKVNRRSVLQGADW